MSAGYWADTILETELSEIGRAIEREIDNIRRAMPDADPELLAEYEAQLIELNREAIDASLLKRPPFTIETYQHAQFHRLASKIRPKSLIQDALFPHMDPFKYGILKQIEEL